MNNFQFLYDKTGELEPKLIMVVSEACEAAMQQHVFPFLEIELMQGTRTILPDSMIEYNLLLSDEKAHILKQALFQAILIDQGQMN